MLSRQQRRQIEKATTEKRDKLLTDLGVHKIMDLWK